MPIEDGSKVAITYTLTLDDGTTADSNVDGEPLVYEQGGGQILPALEAAVAKLEPGGETKVSLGPEQGYGPVHQEAFHRVAAQELPEDAREAGALLVATDPSGRQQMIRVHEVDGDEVVIDANHPLAGQALHFDVKLESVA